MNTASPQDYRNHPALSLELYQQARHARARAISRLFGRVTAHVTTRFANGLASLRRPTVLGAHWG